MATVWPCTDNLGCELNIYYAFARTVRGKTYNGRALTLTQLARRATNIIALRRWADNDGPARWGDCIGRLSTWQHHHHRTGRVIGQRVRVV
jgi:hypothetical protein